MDKQTIEKLVTNNLILSEMIIGDVVYGLLCQVVLIIVSILDEEKVFLYYSLGLWFGIVIAMLLAIHMNRSISKALDFDEKSAANIVRKDAIIRYVILLIIFAILMITDVISPVVAFIGVMGLKIGAYLEPITHNFLRKFGPAFIKAYIANDDLQREQMLERYYEEQKRIEEEKRNKQREKDTKNNKK